MASWEDASWTPDPDSGAPRSQRRAGPYRRYVPDLLDGGAVAIDGELSRRINKVERDVRGLNDPGAAGLAGVARFLLRSEATASSRIEGITPSAQQIALAELGQSETVGGLSRQAVLVANNMTVVRDATSTLVEVDLLEVDHLVALHRSLLPDEEQHHGLREVQNWIGVSDWSPVGAAFVPPGWRRVTGYMQDLVDYMNGAAHSPLVQAALAHAQFETIHPFTDGNGRVGRALIHTVLTRRGLTDQAVLPISLVLATLSEEYVRGLTTFRHHEPAGLPAASAAVNGWLDVFVTAAEVAVSTSGQLLDDIEALRRTWAERLTAHREAQGLRRTPRVDSAAARLLELLPEAPVTTATTLARILGVSYPAANGALDELHQAGILTTRSIGRGTTAYVAREILDLVTLSERQLASTRFDTRASRPARPAPARPS